MVEKAINIVRDYIEKHLDKSDTATLHDGMYYELTYDGEKEVWYLDAYKKFENVVIAF